MHVHSAGHASQYHVISMHIYAISNQKGGVGKTTTAVNLASKLARRSLCTHLPDLACHGESADAVVVPMSPTLGRLTSSAVGQRQSIQCRAQEDVAASDH